VNDDLVKLTVIGAIMGALLLAGLLIHPAGSTTEPQVEPAAATTTVREVTVIQEKSLEMLGPVYSEKAVFQDENIRISFHASFGADGVESRLPFWLYNLSGDVVTILWDRCSIQLPQGNTIKVINEESLKYPGGSGISVAPAGDLFDAVIPVSEITWSDTDWSVSSGVFDQGTFTFVLAIEKGATYAAPKPASTCPEPNAVMPGRTEQMMRGTAQTTVCEECPDGVIVYYAFRFVIR
jgi:hypothetical protein